MMALRPELVVTRFGQSSCSTKYFEFNSLRRSLSSPGQFEQLMDDGIEAGVPNGLGRR
jgi:hypothetical protein